MGLFGESKSSPTKASPLEAPPANQEEEQKRSGNFFSNRFGLGKAQPDVEEEEGTSYSAMKDTKDETSNEQKKNMNKEQTQSSKTDEEETASVSSINIESASKATAFKTMVSSVLPKVEPLPWTTFFCLSVWCAIP